MVNRSQGLEPDPWHVTRDDILGPRALDLTACSARKELESMRGLAMVKTQASGDLVFCSFVMQCESWETPPGGIPVVLGPHKH